MTRLVWVVLLTLTACASHEIKPVTSEISNDRHPTAIYPVATSVDPTFAQVLTTIRAAGALTVDQALAAIKASFPDFLAHYALAYDSLSIQKSTFQKPRVLAYGQAAKLILTFNDATASGGHGAIESREYDATSHGHFREIAFTAETPADEALSPEEIDPSASFRGVQVSKSNIGKCAQCHTDNHPIWENYDLWAGMYGGADDAQYRFGHVTLRGGFRPTGEDREQKEFDAYLKNVAGRYLHLKPIEIPKKSLTIEEEMKDRRNLLLTVALIRQTMHEAVDDLLRLNPSPRSLTALLATIRCFTTPVLDAATMTQTVNEDGGAGLETLARMRRNFPRAKFKPEPWIKNRNLAPFRAAFPRVPEKSAKLASIYASADYQATANFTFRLRQMGLDAHRYFINLRRSSSFDGYSYQAFGDYLVQRLLASDPRGEWAKYKEPNLSDPSICAPGREI